jgi:putative hydrolase of HD superfamily
LYNNFFGALFHDLPEVVTRDIISPVKRSSENIDVLILQLEKELAENEIYPYVEKDWIDELKYFTQDEFTNKIKINGVTVTDKSTKEISEKYNSNEFSAFDGKIIRFADCYSAYLEAKNSIDAGIKSKELIGACNEIRDNYKDYEICEFTVSELFN